MRKLLVLVLLGLCWREKIAKGDDDAGHPGGRAAAAFVGALVRNARQPRDVAEQALQRFQTKNEPLPYLPDFVLPGYVGEVCEAQEKRRVVAHVGCGQATIHPYFFGPGWREVRVDIAEGNQPHVVADMVSVHEHLGEESVDAIYCAHSLEHLTASDAAQALRAFWKILKPGGVILVTVPDTQAALSLLLQGGAEEGVYHLSPDASLPVTPLDLLFGDQRSIHGGNSWMRHQTGFTEATLRDALFSAAFHEVQTFREFAKHYDYVDLWALAVKHSSGLGMAEVHQMHRRGHVGLGSWNLFFQGVGEGFRECVRECGDYHTQRARSAPNQPLSQGDHRSQLYQCGHACRRR
jgi:SAM-dependent methyltransferase